VCLSLHLFSNVVVNSSSMGSLCYRKAYKIKFRRHSNKKTNRFVFEAAAVAPMMIMMMNHHRHYHHVAKSTWCLEKICLLITYNGSKYNFAIRFVKIF
jgi:hypothetical protein